MKGYISTTKDRNYAFDFLRIFAALAVVMIHVSGSFVEEYQSSTPEFIFGNVFDSISRFAVPFFIMITGALMLDEAKEISIGKAAKKYVLPMLLLFVSWSAFYTVVNEIVLPLAAHESIDFVRVFAKLISGNYHMWYLYMLIGLYLITPILKTFVKKENAHLVLWLIALSLVFQFTLPIIETVASRYDILGYVKEFIEKFEFAFLGGYITYYLAGWYIVHVGMSKKQKTILFYIGTICIALIILLTQLFPTQYKNTYTNLNMLVFFYSVALFVFALDRLKKMKENPRNVIFFSSLTFGVYMIHPFFISLFDLVLPYQSGVLVYILLKWICVTLLSLFTTLLITKIPFLKKIVRA